MKISYIDKKIALRLLLIILLDIFFFACSLILLPNTLIQQYILYILLLNVALLFITVYFVITLSNHYLKVRNGETNVQTLLKKDLPPGFFCFHDLVLDKNCTIDFIVVGPTGIWTLEVKSSHGQGAYTLEQLKSNSRISYIKLNQPYTQAIKLKEYIKQNTARDFPVIPVSIFTSKKKQLKFELNKINGVYIIEISQLITLLTSPQFGFILPEENKAALVKLLSFPQSS